MQRLDQEGCIRYPEGARGRGAARGEEEARGEKDVESEQFKMCEKIR